MNQNEVEAAVRAAMTVIQGGATLGAKHDTPGTPVTTGFAHGDQGLWSLAGQNQRVYSLMIGIDSLATRLPAFASVDANPIQSYMTGVQTTSGSNPTSICGPGKTAGLMKTGAIVRQFGKYKFDTPELELNRLGQRVNRGDPLDLFLANGVAGNNLGDTLTPAFPLANDGNAVLVNEIAKRFYELQVAFIRLLADQLYTGNPSNNTPLLAYPNNFYGEFAGLQAAVNTGYRDALTGVATPSLDSDLKDFGSVRVNDNGSKLVTYLTSMWRYLNIKAQQSGFDMVDWAFVMRPEAFWAVADVWPCAYNTTNCTTSAASGATVFVDGASQKAFTNDMLNGRYLMIDGQRIPVIVDNYLPQNFSANGVFGSDIYLLPLRANGVPVLYWQYLDEDNASIAAALNMLEQGGVRTYNRGAYIVFGSRTNGCVKWQAKVQPRLMLDTPQLAGRLQNVRYWVLQHASDPNPASGYHQDGGGTTRSGPSFYQPNAA